MIADDKLSVTLVLTLLAGLVATCYLAWFTYSLEQDQTRRALISTATNLSVVVEQRLHRLTALPAVAAQLPVSAITDLQALLPYVISSEAAADNAGTEPSLEEGTARIGPVIPALNSEGSVSATAIISTRRENRFHLTTVNITILLNELLQPFAEGEIEISFYDLNQFSQDPFYRQRLSAQDPTHGANQSTNQSPEDHSEVPKWLQALQFSSSVPVLGRDWMLRVTPLGSFTQKTTTLMPLVVFIGGCVISLLLAFMLHQKNR